MPSTLTADESSRGSVHTTFTRIVVFPDDGRKEVEGVTPKLPAPEPDETKSIEP